MPRPKKEIDKEQFEKLCGLQCTKDEVCYFFDLTDKTLERWCKDTYGEGFSDVFRKKREVGKISLRRAQYETALKGNASLLIWLGKQYLGQSENVVVGIDKPREDDALTAALKEEAKRLENGDQ
jgi:hypothetical protein